MTPRVAASERGPAQTLGVEARRGLQGCREGRSERSGTRMGRRAGEGESPVREAFANPGSTLSRAGPEEPCPKQAAPSAKAKHYRETDRGRVP